MLIENRILNLVSMRSTAARQLHEKSVVYHIYSGKLIKRVSSLIPMIFNSTPVLYIMFTDEYPAGCWNT